MLKDFEDEYKTAVEQVTSSMGLLRATIPAAGQASASSAGVHNRRERVLAIKASFSKIKEIVAGIERDCAALPSGDRIAAKERVAEYKRAVARMGDDVTRLDADCAQADRAEISAAAAAARTSRQAAAGGGDGAAGSSSGGALSHAEVQEQLGRTTDVKNATTIQLQKGLSLVAGAKQNTELTLEELARQERVMRNIEGTTVEVDQELTQIQRVLREMHREMLKHKGMLAAIIVVLLIMIVGILYFKYGGSSTSSSTGAGTAAPPFSSSVIAPPPPPSHPGGGQDIPEGPRR